MVGLNHKYPARACAAGECCLGSGSGLSVIVDGVPGISNPDRQGRHGLRRLQATRRAGRLDGLADATADYFAVFHGQGAVVGIALIVVRGRDRNIPIPFGPYLAAAGWIALLWGNQIVTFILNVLPHRLLYRHTRAFLNALVLRCLILPYVSG